MRGVICPITADAAATKHPVDHHIGIEQDGHCDRTENGRPKKPLAADLVYDAREIYELGPVVSVTDEMEYDFDFDMLYEENRGNLLGRFMEKVQALDTDMETRKKILNYGFRALYHTGEQP